MPVATWQTEATIVQHAHDPGNGANLQKEVKNRVEPFLNGQVRILEHHAVRVAHETDRQGKRRFTTLRLCDQASCQAAADRMQLQFGNGSLQARKQAPIGAAGIVDAIVIGDETPPAARRCQKAGTSRNNCGRDVSRRLTG